MGSCPACASELVVPLRHKAQDDRRPEPAQRERRAFTAQRRGHPPPVRGPRRGRHRQRAAVRAERQDAEALETLAEIGREVASMLDLDELLTRIAQPDQAGHRLSHLRHPAGQRADAGTRNEAGRQLRREGTAKHVKLGEGLVGYAALHREAVLVPDVSTGSALHQPRRDVTVGAGHPDAAQGPLHRRLRPREPGAQRVHQAGRRIC